MVAMNPCLCGNRTNPKKVCTCTPGQLAAYDRKISDMILDRIDLHISVDAVDPMKISDKDKKNLMSTKEMRERVAFTRERQRERYSADILNAKLTKAQIEKYIVLKEDVREFLRKAYDTMSLTMRTYNKTLTVSRTIADMEGEEDISINHVAEALQYRSKGYGV